MARIFAARRWRGLAAVAPVGALLALAAPLASGQNLQVHTPDVPQVHVPQVSLPQVHVPQVRPPQVGGPVQPAVNSGVGTVNSVTRRLGGTTGGGGSPGSTNNNGTTGPAGGSSSGQNPTGGPGGGGAGGGGGGGAGTGRGGGGAGGGGGATGAAARRRALRTALAAATLGLSKGAKGGSPNGSSGGGPGVPRLIRDVIKVIPGPLKILIGVLAALAFGFWLRSFFATRRARQLEQHREQLLGDIGLLQKALLADVPDRVGALDATVAYRPADGPGAGGDFYDVFEMERERVGIIVGDVCGHGREALAMTSLMRYTLRAYLTGGGEPRAALQAAARTLENEPHAELTTVVLAVYDGNDGTLTYACAGHEPPILLGAPAHKPVTVGSSPPIGAGLETGLRQTTVALSPGSMAFFFTDGLVEARLGDGLLGRERLADIARELGDDARADMLLERIAERADRAPDDMAACILRARDDAHEGDRQRIEELELDGAPEDEERAKGFLAACGMPPEAAETVLKKARGIVAEFGAAVLRVELGKKEGRTDVVPYEPAIRLGANGNGNGAPSALGAVPRISA